MHYAGDVFSDALIGLRFAGTAVALLRRPVRLEQARAALRRRLERREAGFLALIRERVYGSQANPYRALLRLARCEYGDLERLVAREGVDGTLRILYRHGVYLTGDELKGRRTVARGSQQVALGQVRLLSGRSRLEVWAHSSGSRGAGTVVPYSLAHIRERAVNTLLVLEALGGASWRHAKWGVPGSGSLVHLLDYAAIGSPPRRWFTHVDPAAPGLHPRYRHSARALRLAGYLAGAPLPSPEHAPPRASLSPARWMVDVLRAGEVPHLHTYTSSAVQLCQAAKEAGLDISGARFTVGGEPFTAARLAAIRAAGAEALQHYAAVESSHIAYGCQNPLSPDDLHLLHDFNALISLSATEATAELPPDALLITSLRPTAPLLLLNVSLGDQASLEQRACGCPLERIGWRFHLQAVRSFQKLTLGGLTLLDSSVSRVLEEQLPCRFGGGPTDYQLVEDEGAAGVAVLRLLVHPRVGEVDAQALATAFLSSLAERNGSDRLAALQWGAAGLPIVERREPLATDSGKILHLHQVVGRDQPSPGALPR